MYDLNPNEAIVNNKIAVHWDVPFISGLFDTTNNTVIPDELFSTV